MLEQEKNSRSTGCFCYGYRQPMRDWDVTPVKQQQKRRFHVCNWRAGNWRDLEVILVVNEELRKGN